MRLVHTVSLPSEIPTTPLWKLVGRSTRWAILVALLVGAILIIIPRWAAVAAAFSLGWVALVLFTLAVVALMATAAFLQRTSVRGT